MSARMNGQTAARTKARERRIALDAERVAREKRVEDSATAFYVAADQHAARVTELHQTERVMGSHLAAMVAEDQDVERVAALCDLTTARVRQLIRLTRDGAAVT